MFAMGLWSAGSTTPPGLLGVEAFLGQSVEEFCPFGFGKKGDDHNHCAHFVCHALRFTQGTGLTCDGMVSGKAKQKLGLGGQRGALVRVHNLYNDHCANKRALAKGDDATGIEGLVFVTLSSNYAKDLSTLGNIPRKHVGILTGGFVINYNNAPDKVAKEELPAFRARMQKAYGAPLTFVATDLPTG